MAGLSSISRDITTIILSGLQPVIFFISANASLFRQCRCDVMSLAHSCLKIFIMKLELYLKLEEIQIVAMVDDASR